jgi:hypothetical protein
MFPVGGSRDETAAPVAVTSGRGWPRVDDEPRLAVTVRVHRRGGQGWECSMNGGSMNMSVSVYYPTSKGSDYHKGVGAEQANYNGTSRTSRSTFNRRGRDRRHR